MGWCVGYGFGEGGIEKTCTALRTAAGRLNVCISRHYVGWVDLYCSTDYGQST